MAHGAHASFGLPKHEIDSTADDAESKLGRKRQLIGIVVRPTVSPLHRMINVINLSISQVL